MPSLVAFFVGILTVVVILAVIALIIVCRALRHAPYDPTERNDQ